MGRKRGPFGYSIEVLAVVACIGLAAFACVRRDAPPNEPSGATAGGAPNAGFGYAGFAYAGSNGTEAVPGGAGNGGSGQGGGSGGSGGSGSGQGGGSGGMDIVTPGGSGGAQADISGGSGGSATGGTGGAIAAGAGGDTVAGSGGQAGTEGPVAVGTVIPDRCHGDYSKTVMIGDSYLAWTGDITMFLEQYAGQDIARTYYLSGAGMVKGINVTIPDQFTLFAEPAGPIQTILMTGGGNDVLIGDPTCALTGLTAGSICEITVNDAIAASQKLMGTTAAAGVQETIYFFYPHINNDALNTVLDQVYPMAQSTCEDQQMIDCSFIDTRAGCGALPAPIGPDGIHPSRSCSEVIAQLMWEAMEENCANGVTVYQ
jgi:hypothetical protein